MRTISVAIRLLKQLLNQKRMLIFFIFSPIISFSIFYFVLNSSNEKIKIGIFSDKDISSLYMKNDNISYLPYKNREEMKSKIKSGDIDLGISIEDKIEIDLGGLNYFNNQNQKNVANMFLMNLKIKALLPDTVNKNQDILFNNVYKINDFNFFETLSPIFISITIFCLVFIFSGMVFFKERETKTMSRIMLTPLKSYEFLFGYFIAFGILVATQTVVLQFFCVNILHLKSNSNFISITLIGIIISFLALSIGFFLSMFAKSEFEVAQVIPITLLPQIALCGMFDVSQSKLLTMFANFIPLKYASDTMINLVIKGESIRQQGYNISIMVIFTVLFIILSVIYIKKYKA